MRWITVVSLVLTLPFLTACDDDDAAEITRLKAELDAANIEVVKLQAKVESAATLVSTQRELYETAQKTTQSALEACTARGNDNELKELMASFAKQCVTSVEEINEKVTQTVNNLADPDVEPKPTPKPEPEPVKPDCADTAEGCDRTEANPCVIDSNAPGCVTPDDDPCKANVHGPGCTGPIAQNDPKPEDFDGSQEDFKKMILLAGAYMACEAYSAGTCGVVLALVGADLGLGEGDVKEQSKQAYEQLGENLANRGITMPGPNGRPITLKANLPLEVSDAAKAYTDMTVEDQNDICKVLALFRDKVTPVREFLAAIGTPYKFPSIAERDKAIKISDRIDLKLSDIIAKIPAEGDSTVGPLACG